MKKDITAIVNAAKCTSFLLIEEQKPGEKSSRRYYGTAFFISPRLLVTAGHNVIGVHGPISQLCITHPGVEMIDLRQVALRTVPTINCKVVGSLYKKEGPFSKDIAILDAGSFNASHYLPLSKAIAPQNAVIDIVGYPAQIKDEWLEAHDGIDVQRAQDEAKCLLPKGRLLVTRGNASATSGTAIPYHITTCPGFGGSCVLYNGAVIGKFRLGNDD